MTAMNNPKDSSDYDEFDSCTPSSTVQYDGATHSNIIKPTKDPEVNVKKLIVPMLDCTSEEIISAENTSTSASLVPRDIAWHARNTGHRFKQVFEAAVGKDWELVTMLLRGCPSVADHKNGDGETLLHLAAWWNHSKLVDLLREQKSKKTEGTDPWPDYIKRTNKRGLLALHITALKGNFGITELLLNDKADAMARTKAGQTPLHLAVLWGHKEVAELLVKHGAKKDAEDGRGKTPIDMATIRNDKPILEFLQIHA